MDQKELQQKIAEYYLKLPAKAQTFFSSMKWVDTLQNISKKYTLSGEQNQTLGTETTLLLLGITSFEQYVESIKKDITLPEDALNKILGEVEESVLKDVKSDIEQAYASNIKKLEDELAPDLDPAFVNLPKELQEAIAQSDYQKKLYEIGTKNKLRIDKMGKLEEVTIKFMKGGISPSQYENQLALEIDIEASLARAIAEEVNESILKTIREIMKSQMVTGASDGKGESNIDREVPLPPYAKLYDNKYLPDAVIEKNKPDKILQGEKGGVIFENSSTTKESPIRTTEKIPPITEAKAPETTNIPKPPYKDMLMNKLTSVNIGATVVSDYSMSKKAEDAPLPTAPTPSSTLKAPDPYHEAIE